jgi:DNA-directed RNA polymerase specialized sigma24 family protein
MSRLDDLYARYLTPLTRELIAFGQTEGDAEDFAQEALIALWKRLDTVNPKKEWWWLLATAKNIARDHVTRENREKHGGGRVTHLADEHLDLKGNDPSAEAALLQGEEIASFQANFKALMRALSMETQLAIV